MKGVQTKIKDEVIDWPKNAGQAVPLDSLVRFSIPENFKCGWIREGETDCAKRGKMCHICEKAVHRPTDNYFTPYTIKKT